MTKKLTQSRERLASAVRAHQKQVADKKPLPIHHRHWREFGISALVGLVIGVALSAVMVRFSFAKVELAGIPVSTNSTQVQMEEALAEKLKNYQVTVKYADDSTKSFSLPDMGVTVDTTQSVKDALTTQRPDNYFKRMKWWGKTEVPLVLHVDSAALETFVQTQATQVVTPGKDAAIGIDQGTVIVTPAQVGEGYTVSGGSKAVSEAVGKLQTKPLSLERQELIPAISDENATAAAENIKTLLQTPVSFTINNKQITAKPADIGSWMDITPTPPNHTIDYSVNSGKVLTYMNSIARPFVQPPVTQIAMPNGAVIVPGQNGVDITNKESTAADVAKQLNNKQAVAMTLPVQYASFKSITAEARDKWIVVDTTSKRMYAYEQNNLVRSFLVSAGAPATPTVTGQYAVYSKYPSQDMRGANADGSRYYQPNVRWVMYFYRDYAIHGNYWRPLSYFGSVNSSHGCVGVLNADAEWLYNWAPIGTTVIVHR